MNPWQIGSISRVEDRLTVIAARDDVIKITLDFNSRLPGHGPPILFFAPRCVRQDRKIAGPDPVPTFAVPTFEGGSLAGFNPWTQVTQCRTMRTCSNLSRHPALPESLSNILMMTNT